MTPSRRCNRISVSIVETLIRQYHYPGRSWQLTLEYIDTSVSKRRNNVISIRQKE